MTKLDVVAIISSIVIKFNLFMTKLDVVIKFDIYQIIFKAREAKQQNKSDSTANIWIAWFVI